MQGEPVCQCAGVYACDVLEVTVVRQLCVGSPCIGWAGPMRLAFTGRIRMAKRVHSPSYIPFLTKQAYACALALLFPCCCCMHVPHPIGAEPPGWCWLQLSTLQYFIKACSAALPWPGGLVVPLQYSQCCINHCGFECNLNLRNSYSIRERAYSTILCLKSLQRCRPLRGRTPIPHSSTCNDSNRGDMQPCKQYAVTVALELRCNVATAVLATAAVLKHECCSPNISEQLSEVRSNHIRSVSLDIAVTTHPGPCCLQTHSWQQKPFSSRLGNRPVR
jgi:hypothetical protein